MIRWRHYTEAVTSDFRLCIKHTFALKLGERYFIVTWVLA